MGLSEKHMVCETFLNYLKIMEPDVSPEEYINEISDLADSIKQDKTFETEVTLFKSLANDLRYLILKIIKQKPMCTCSLANTLDLKEGTISHHLKILEHAGLIVGKKKGYYTVYYPEDQKKILIA